MGNLHHMTHERHVTFYLDDGLRNSAEAGRHNFISRLISALQRAGFSTEFRQNSAEERLNSASRPGYALFHMDDPFHPRAMSFRRAYFYPFWNIERSAERWNFRTARATFDPKTVKPENAARFAGRMRDRHFPDTGNPQAKNLVLVPLQGRLLQHRSFQQCGPLDMLEATLQHCAGDDVLATLHPNERYSPKERQALSDLGQRHPNLRVQTGGTTEALSKCRLVVSENSAVAFSGYLFAKPAVLFAKIDFHHIAANVAELGAAGAFEAASKMQPDYDRYVFWFLQKRAINAGRPEAEAKILAALGAGGWPI